MMKLKIFAGGQTGVDEAALRFALRYGLKHGGFCPRGRRREDGVIPGRFRLQETRSRGYLERTRMNVKVADVTLVFSVALRLKGGTRKTVELARKLRKPCLHLAAQDTNIDHVMALRRFMRQNRVRILNVAGPRQSQEPGAARFATKILRAVFAESR